MSKPQLPVLTHLQFLVLGVLRNEDLPGRVLRDALSGYGIRRTGPAFYQLMARLEKDRLVDGRYEQITVGDQAVTERRYRITPEGKKRWGEARAFYEDVARAATKLRWSDAWFRRGLGRWLPREAERDLFHPSLEDLRAARLGAIRMRLATIALWIDCWRVWLSPFDSRTRAFRARSLAQGGPARVDSPARKAYLAMFFQDLRRAFRLFRLEPGFAAAAVLTLALGIGANTALFAVVEAVLLRPLPVTDAERLVVIKYHQTNTGITKEFLGVGDLIDLKERQQTLEQLAPYGSFQATLYGDDEPMRVEGFGATPEGLAALRVQPAMGRMFNADDMQQKAPPVVMISHDLWQTRFGSDPGIVSRSIQLGNQRPMVVGVLPRGFHFPPNAAITQIAVPVKLPAAAPAARQSGWVPAFGRLKDGQTIESARAEFLALSAEFERLYLSQNKGLQYRVESLRDSLVGDTKRPLLLLLAAVGLVLLIACVNVGNLLLARSLAAARRWRCAGRSVRRGRALPRRCSSKAWCSRWPAAPLACCSPGSWRRRSPRWCRKRHGSRRCRTLVSTCPWCSSRWSRRCSPRCSSARSGA